MKDRAEDRPGAPPGENAVDVRWDDSNVRGLHASVGSVTGTREELTPMCPPSPPVAPGSYDLDMTRLEDEQLVVLAAECDYRPARDELIRRSLPLTERLVGGHAAHSGLQEADRQDPQQDAVLSILAGIRRHPAA